jgi:hypothetical protein
MHRLQAGGGLACAVASDGAVRCWGFSALGSVGDGTPIDHLSTTPVVVQGLSHSLELSVIGRLNLAASSEPARNLTPPARLNTVWLHSSSSRVDSLGLTWLKAK